MLKQIITLSSLMIILTGSMFGQDNTLEKLNSRIKALEENRLAGIKTSWLKNMTLSGVVEVEGAFARTDWDSTRAVEESNLVLATFELGISAEISDWISAETVLLWEEDDTEPVDLDLALLHFANKAVSPFYMEVGKGYVPFGPCEARHIHCARFDTGNEPPHESSFITDPMTLELGEMRESYVRFGGAFGVLDLSLSIFNGDVEEIGDAHSVDNYVLAVTYAQQLNESTSLACGVAYTNNIADSDGITAQLENTSGGLVVNDSVGGINAFLSVGIGPAGILAEYVGATDDFKAGELFALEAARPEAWNLEASWAVTDQVGLAVKYETANDTFDWLPETRYGITAGYTVYDGDNGNATLAIEYLRGEYSIDDQEIDTFTIQFAIEF